MSGNPISQAAKRLGISDRMLCELIARGDLRSFTIGRRRLISDNAIDDYIAHREALESERREKSAE